MIVRNCKQGIVKFMPTILEIIQTCLDPEKEVELKMDMLVILEFIISLKEIEASLKEKSIQIISVTLDVHSSLPHCPFPRPSTLLRAALKKTLLTELTASNCALEISDPVNGMENRQAAGQNSQGGCDQPNQNDRRQPDRPREPAEMRAGAHSTHQNLLVRRLGTRPEVHDLQPYRKASSAREGAHRIRANPRPLHGFHGETGRFAGPNQD